MARAEIYIEDVDNMLGVSFRFPGGLPDPRSNAHQVANMIRMYLDEIMDLAPDQKLINVHAADTPGVAYSAVPEGILETPFQRSATDVIVNAAVSG